MVKGFGIVNKAEIDVFLELSCFFHDPADVGNFISGSSAFSKTNFNTWKFTVHILLKPGLENFSEVTLLYPTPSYPLRVLVNIKKDKLLINATACIDLKNMMLSKVALFHLLQEPCHLVSGVAFSLGAQAVICLHQKR